MICVLFINIIQFSVFQQRLNHPNIVKILGFVDNPRIVIVMEHIKHSSFDKYLCSKAPNITTQILLKFAKDIASVSMIILLFEMSHNVTR
jgi:serine/threonine protein kinase